MILLLGLLGCKLHSSGAGRRDSVTCVSWVEGYSATPTFILQGSPASVQESLETVEHV